MYRRLGWHETQTLRRTASFRPQNFRRYRLYPGTRSLSAHNVTFRESYFHWDKRLQLAQLESIDLESKIQTGCSWYLHCFTIHSWMSYVIFWAFMWFVYCCFQTKNTWGYHSTHSTCFRRKARKTRSQRSLAVNQHHRFLAKSKEWAVTGSTTTVHYYMK